MVIQKILRYDPYEPRIRDRNLVKILLIASEELPQGPPAQEERRYILEEIYITEKLTHGLRLHEAQLEDDRKDNWQSG